MLGTETQTWRCGDREVQTGTETCLSPKSLPVTKGNRGLGREGLGVELLKAGGISALAPLGSGLQVGRGDSA